MNEETGRGWGNFEAVGSTNLDFPEETFGRHTYDERLLTEIYK